MAVQNTRERTTLSIIDSLSKGFQTIGRHWWVILVPVVLDMFLWVGPQISIAPIIDRAAGILLETDLIAEAWAEVPDLADTLRSLFDDIAEQYNLFSLARIKTVGMPSLLVWGGAGLNLPSAYEVIWVYFIQMIDLPDLLVSVSRATFLTAQIWYIQNEGLWLIAALAIVGIGLVISTIYITLISDSLAGPDTLGAFWRRVTRLSGRILLFWLVKIIALIVLGLPFSLLISLVSLFSPNLAFLFSVSGMGALAWFSFYGVFFVASLVINNVSIWHALWNSLNVVLRNFWPTLWLFILINLIGGGLTILWQQLSRGSWLTVVGIVGNAYVGTSLLAGSLIFYQDRYTRWRESVAEILNQKEKPANS